MIIEMTFAWKGSPIVRQGLPRIASILLIDGVSNEHVHDGDDQWSCWGYEDDDDDGDVADHLLVGAVARIVAGVVVLGVATALKEGL